MNNYKLINNKEWKEVEINGEMKNIPINWALDSFSTLVKEQTKKSNPEATLEEYCINLEDFQSDSGKITSYSNWKDNKSLKTEFQSNDILYGKLRPYLKKYWFADRNGMCSSEILVLRPKHKNNKFPFFIVRTNAFNELANKNSHGTKMPRTSWKELQLFSLGIPSFDEQLAIADILSEQENVIHDIENLINKHEARLQYLSDKLLSGYLRVKEQNGQTIIYKNPVDNWKEVEINGDNIEIPLDWECFSMKGNIKIQTGKKDANFSQPNGPYAFFTCGREILKAPQYSFDCEAILIAGNGEVGETKYYHGKFEAYQRTYVLSDYKYNLKHLYNYINLKFKESISALGSAMPYIKLGDLENFIIVKPKSILEEKIIVNIIEDQKFLIINQKEILLKEKTKFEWLLDNLLSGKYLIK